MDVRLGAEREELRDGARAFLARECPMALVRETLEGSRAAVLPLFMRMAERGYAGLALPQRYGGAGRGLLDLALVLEESGRALAPGPLLATAIGGLALWLGGREEQRQALLPRVARGDLRPVLAGSGSGVRERGPGVEARPAAGGFALRGAVSFVPEAELADLLLVPARLASGAGGEVGIFLVDPGAAGVSLVPVESVDLTRRQADLRLLDARVERDALLGEPGDGAALLERVLDVARVALCAEMTGGAAAALECGVAYAKAREQFGGPIGRFQGVQHQCADMLVRSEGARALCYEAAWAFDAGDPGAHASACLAKAYCSDAYVFVAGRAIQIHGGQGFTWDRDPQLHYKRAVADALALGDAAWHRELASRALFD